jgi:3-hydroxyisobutyrate dehydrogenase-like beta-hydroxyacid dehydrogenase
MHIAFIGFGEAARAFTASLKERGVETFTAYDIKQGTPAGGDVETAAAELGVTLAGGPVAAVAGRRLDHRGGDRGERASRRRSRSKTG